MVIRELLSRPGLHMKAREIYSVTKWIVGYHWLIAVIAFCLGFALYGLDEPDYMRATNWGFAWSLLSIITSSKIGVILAKKYNPNAQKNVVLAVSKASAMILTYACVLGVFITLVYRFLS